MSIRQNAIIFFISFFVISPFGENWLQYRGNASRSGYTSEVLPTALSLHWLYKNKHVPHPAWSDRSIIHKTARDTRMPFDLVYRIVVGNGLLYFGSSVDCKVYALDAITGEQRWSFFTEAPIRFAPAIWKDRLFVVSDDGYLYCLSAKEGKLLWKKQGGPQDDMVLGNDRMIARWPARGGPVIINDIVFWGAGIWSSEKTYIYAVKAETGKVIWVKDSSDNIVWRYAHDYNAPGTKMGIPVQGYLVGAGDMLFVPTGRGVPAGLKQSNGQVLYFHLGSLPVGITSGSDIIGDKNYFITGGLVYDAKTDFVWKDAIFSQNPWEVSVCTTVKTPKEIISHCKNEVKVFQWEAKELKQKWSSAVPYSGTSLIVAGQTIISAGEIANKCSVNFLDITLRKIIWTADVEGRPLDLAVANGYLYVSTDKGYIYCYGTKREERERIIEDKQEKCPYGNNEIYEKIAEDIIKNTGITKGYCVDLGCGNGALSYALAKLTNLQIYAIDANLENVAIARQKLDAAGLYGVKVTIHHGNPKQTIYPNCFANLVIARQSIDDDVSVVNRNEVYRLLRPYGGVTPYGGIAVIGKSMEKIVRGPLKEGGEWTHQFANAANTLCSGDNLVTGIIGEKPLKMLWFTDFNFQMPNRHGRSPAPLFKDGILVIEGLDGILAVDAYNGSRLWNFPCKDILKPYNNEALSGIVVTNSNICLSGDSVYLRAANQCLRLILTTGEKIKEYFVPIQDDNKSGKWGYIACVDGILYGTRVNETHFVRAMYLASDTSGLFTQSDRLFALDVDTGEKKWTYKPKYSIGHNAIAIGGSRVYVIDRPLNSTDMTGGETLPTIKGVLRCLDASTGKILWENEDIDGATLALSTEYKIIIMGFNRVFKKYTLPSEYGYSNSLSAFSISDGKKIWEVNGDEYRNRPIIIKDTVYTMPYAYNLLTGKRKQDFEFNNQGYACGYISASFNLFLFRSGSLGYYPVSGLKESNYEGYPYPAYGGSRPGCGINALPVGGIVLMPDFTDNCICNYPNKTSFALQSTEGINEKVIEYFPDEKGIQK